VDDRAWTRAALERLLGLGITSLVVEGGPSLQRTVWESDVVDCVQLFVTPAVLGSGGVPWLPLDVLSFASLAAATARPLGDDVLMEAYVHRVD
jgi:diaminohydroxyphosphoribosylaminopyrimidine deaminase/5-amino-6-(5-phosphoribosylamino)uracil reductase